jgi:hypothetical protein
MTPVTLFVRPSDSMVLSQLSLKVHPSVWMQRWIDGITVFWSKSYFPFVLSLTICSWNLLITAMWQQFREPLYKYPDFRTPLCSLRRAAATVSTLTSMHMTHYFAVNRWKFVAERIRSFRSTVWSSLGVHLSLCCVKETMKGLLVHVSSC